MTLLEILVVMSIITIIASAIVVAALSFHKSAQIKATRGFLEKLAQGQEQYKSAHGMYVPQDIYRTSNALWYALEDRERYVTVETSYKIPGITSGYQYTDVWKQPLRYDCAPPYMLFTITSNGPDIEPNSGDEIEIK